MSATSFDRSCHAKVSRFRLAEAVPGIHSRIGGAQDSPTAPRSPVRSPRETGRWDPQEPIEVKPFARLMWDRIGEDAIFDGVASLPAAVPVAMPTDDVVELAINPESNGAVEPNVPADEPAEDVVDLQEVEDVQEPEEHADDRPRSTTFEEENLDLGDYDDLCAFAEEEIRGKG